MKLLLHKLRHAAGATGRRALATQGPQGPTAAHAPQQVGARRGSSVLRQTLVLGGLGLSMLAIAQLDAAGASNGQCDARYTPEYSGENVDTAFSLPLESERAGKLAPSAAAGAFSCASYKANFPIEDRYDLQTSASGEVFALVLDGHGGWQVSEYGRKVLIENVRKELQHLTSGAGGAAAANPQDPEDGDHPRPTKHQVSSAIQRGFARTDRALMAKVTEAFQLGFGAVGRCGSCALLVYVHDRILHVANAGDIRAVLGKRSGRDAFVAVPLSSDQNAMAKSEQERLKREHSGEDNVFVCRRPDSCYVKGALQPTRALGDFALKHSEFNGPAYVNGDRSAGRHIPAPYTPPYITAIPEVRTHDLHADDEFVIIGSDGVWDFLTNDEAVEVVREQLARGTPEEAGRAIVERTLQRAAARYGMSYFELLSLPPGSNRRRRHDDTTAVVVFLKHQDA